MSDGRGCVLSKTKYCMIVVAVLFFCNSLWADFQTKKGPLSTRWAKVKLAKDAVITGDNKTDNATPNSCKI
jgi:hypothetical protein